MASVDFIKETQKPYSEEVLLILAEFSFPDIEGVPQPSVYLVADNTEVTHKGNLYTPANYTYQPPQTGSVESNITIDDITQEMIYPFMRARGEVIVKISVVLSSDVETVEQGPYSFFVDNISVKGYQVKASLTQRSILRNSMRGRLVNSSFLPGLYI